MSTISQRLKTLRENQNMTIKEVSERANIPVTTYREWESGREITGEPYVKLAYALNVTLYELLTGEKSNVADLLTEFSKIESMLMNFKKNLISSE